MDFTTTSSPLVITHQISSSTVLSIRPILGFNILTTSWRVQTESLSTKMKERKVREARLRKRKARNLREKMVMGIEAKEMLRTKALGNLVIFSFKRKM